MDTYTEALSRMEIEMVQFQKERFVLQYRPNVNSVRLDFRIRYAEQSRKNCKENGPIPRKKKPTSDKAETLDVVLGHFFFGNLIFGSM